FGYVQSGGSQPVQSYFRTVHRLSRDHCLFHALRIGVPGLLSPVRRERATELGGAVGLARGTGTFDAPNGIFLSVSLGVLFLFVGTGSPKPSELRHRSDSGPHLLDAHQRCEGREPFFFGLSKQLTLFCAAIRRASIWNRLLALVARDVGDRRAIGDGSAFPPARAFRQTRTLFFSTRAGRIEQ